MIKKLLTISIACGILCMTVILTSAIYTTANYFHASTEHKDCAVIFGAAVWRDNIPSHALYDRTMTGIDLYKNDIVSCLILSGGPSTFGAHETDVMYVLARKNDVDAKDIVKDPNGLNTRATIKNLPPKTSFIFVSNDFHLGRIALLARQNNVSDFALHKATYKNGRYIKEPQFFFHEVIGNIFYFFHINTII